MGPPNDVPSTATEPAPPSGAAGPVVVRANVWRRPSRGVILATVMLAVAACVVATLAGGHSIVSRAAAFAVYGFFVGAIALGRRRAVRVSRLCEVHAGHAGLAVEGKPIARERIQSAMTSYDVFGPAVRVDLRGLAGDYVLHVGSPEWARAIVAALGFDTRRTTATFWAASRVNEGWITLAALVALPIVFGFGFHSVAVTIALASIGFVLAALVPTKVVVGMDGVVVRWLFDRLYFPLGNITFVERMPARVRLHLKGGKTFDVAFRGRETSDVVEAGMLAERIVDAIERRAQLESPIDPVLLARPTGVEARAWIESLHELLREGTFREAPVTTEQLWGVVENSTMDATRRAAAAIALRHVLDDRGKKRLRIAAQATAAPHLRVALERAADGDDASVLEAVEELDRTAG